MDPQFRRLSSTLASLFALCVIGQAQQLTVDLSAAMYNGSEVPCFGVKQGTIQCSPAGGVAPYTFDWSNGESTTSITGVPAGFYRVKVTDSNGLKGEAEITLNEPEALRVEAVPFKYANGSNVSCVDCYNGSIDVTVFNGTPPYSYSWSDGPLVTQDRSGLGASDYRVVVTDVNGCVEKVGVLLTQPDRQDWTMQGNANTDPMTQYIGTSDDKDVVFKSNSAEVLRLKNNGDIRLLGSLTDEGPLFRMEDGTLRSGGGLDLYPTLPPDRCRLLRSFPYWETVGNAFPQLCPDEIPKLGTLESKPLRIITNGEERMRVTSTGEVAIGATYAPETKLHVQGDLLVRGGTFGDIITRSNETEGATLWARNNGAAWGLSISPDGKGHILGDWNNPTPHITFTYDQIEMPTSLVIGDIAPLGGFRLSVEDGIRTERMVIGDVTNPTGYRLYVEEGILTERVKVAIHSEGDWMDMVFHPNYTLMPLKDVSTFIQENSHLPEVPSAECMVEEGLDVAKMDALLLQKVEELTLYLIAMEKRMTELEKENVELRRVVDKF